jgi:hypothetical protein
MFEGAPCAFRGRIMGFASKNKLFALTLVPLLITGYASSNCSAQSADQGAAPLAPSDASNTDADYFSQHFSTDALAPDMKSAVINANLDPVSFNRIVLHTRDQVTSTGQGNAGGVYTVEATIENADHGLVRRKESAQTRGAAASTRLDLMYRGYFPFLTQNVPTDKSTISPVIEARKVLHFDTKTDGHISFVYLYGAAGQATFADPGQVICESGKRYSASQLNASIQGQALELNCQAIDNNGMVTNKMTLAYLEKYDVAVTLHMQNQGNSLDSTVTDFTVQ